MGVRVKGQELDVDILEEIESFDWVRGEIKTNKFQACSPFRVDLHPSFAINLEDGTWKDSGSTDDYLIKGNLTKLLAILRGETYETVEDYLLQKYSLILSDTSALELSINLDGENVTPTYFTKETLKHLYPNNYDYLLGRGISKDVQDLFGIGYLVNSLAVALPWSDLKGNICNVKYRRTDTKRFFYEKGGTPISKLVFGAYLSKLEKATVIYLCESETDALYLWTYGYCGVAVGGSNLTDIQKDIILGVGATYIVICTDNDGVGNNFANSLIKEFTPHLGVYRHKFPVGVNDINDLSSQQMLDIKKRLIKPTISFLK
jgi:DNA primase